MTKQKQNNKEVWSYHLIARQSSLYVNVGLKITPGASLDHNIYKGYIYVLFVAVKLLSLENVNGIKGEKIKMRLTYLVSMVTIPLGLSPTQ